MAQVKNRVAVGMPGARTGRRTATMRRSERLRAIFAAAVAALALVAGGIGMVRRGRLS